MHLYELGKGKAVYPGEYSVLYHLCEYNSFSYALSHDVLQSRRSYLSTTWDETMNYVVGRDHAFFKFVLRGDLLIENFGGFHYDDYAIELGTNRKVSHNEREIGIDTTEVKPLTDYLLGTVLLFDLFSESGLQWLLYENLGRAKGFMSEPRGAAPQAIYLIDRHIHEWDLPLWKKTVGKQFSSDEIKYLAEVKEVADMKLPFTKSLEMMAKKYSITDHWGKEVDELTYARRHMAPYFVKMINGYFAGRKYDNVDIKQVRAILEKIMKMLALGDNVEAMIMHAIDSSGLLHPATAPVDWGTVIKTMMDGDPDEIFDTIQWVAKHRKGERDWYDQEAAREDGSTQYRTHIGTGFGRG